MLNSIRAKINPTSKRNEKKAVASTTYLMFAQKIKDPNKRMLTSQPAFSHEAFFVRAHPTMHSRPKAVHVVKIGIMVRFTSAKNQERDDVDDSETECLRY